MSLIHPTAALSSAASIAEGVSIGPYAVIGAATVGPGTVIHPHAIIGDGVVLGAEIEVFPGAVIGREPKGAGATARKPVFEPTVRIGDRCSIGPHAVIYYDVEIGSETLIGDGASIREQCRVGSRCIISRYVTLNYNTVVGDRSKVMDLTHLTGNMVIGEDVFISTMVASANDNRVTGGFGDHCVGPRIESGVVVGAGAILLPAITIGSGAVVGAGAVVTKDVAPSAVVMGTPARPRA